MKIIFHFTTLKVMPKEPIISVGKGKKPTTTATTEQTPPATSDPKISPSNNEYDNLANNLSTSPGSPMQGSKLGIATPPQPFSQSQPAPSVITRMLQSQPGHPAYPVGTSGAYYPGDQQGPPPVDVALSNSQGNAGQFAQGESK